MPNKMLIDASHPEETRVVVLRGNRVEEFDYESASRKPLRGNIYLAKVTRVEPSLQAAFVEYGGNRHGFLAFSEIHPDYYQIPVADRQALLEEEARGHESDDEEEEERRPRRSRRRRKDNGAAEQRRHATQDDQISEPDAALGDAETEADAAGLMIDVETVATSEVEHLARNTAALGEPEDVSANDLPHGAASDSVRSDADLSLHNAGGIDPDGYEPSSVVAQDETVLADGHPAPMPTDHVEAVDDALAVPDHADEDDDDEDDEEEEHVEQIGGDALEETPRRKPRMRRHYKIQEVIKRRQVLLVQVVKEERGNKGAALTTYLSLAGRYSVLMPNTARGGGISRKITDTGDRKRLKSIVQDLDVPEGMGIILRTAGAARTRPEVQRDFEYLLRMWENVRELTLRSSAPTLVYEEGSLIKRAIRDLFNKEIEDVVVAGDAAWQEARDFMRLIMPGHVRNVVPWRESQPIFVRSGAESQLDALFSNHVTLRSGGYIVINQTEALVAIDVNSGRSTREHNIEDTALRTNLEASDEVARQLRLRDLAGLIVVDFIDMEENRNNRAVERRLKEALKNDRARIQVGRISHFGLLEMSRQRIRTGVLEGSSAPCPHCAGLGMVRSVSSVSLHILRVLEDALTKSASHNVVVRTRTEVALYILNEKRSHLRDIERRFGMHISVEADETLPPHVHHALERGEPASGVAEPFVAPVWEPEPEEEIVAGEVATTDDLEGTDDADVTDEGVSADADERGVEGEDGQRRRRRRRRRRGGRGERDAAPGAESDAAQSDETFAATGAEAGLETAVDDATPRDGYWTRERSNTPVPFEPAAIGAVAETTPLDDEPSSAHPAAAPPTMEHYAQAEMSLVDAAPRDTNRSIEALPEPVVPAMEQQQPTAPDVTSVRPPREPTEVIITQADPDKPKRGGWWSRAKATLGGT